MVAPEFAILSTTLNSMILQQIRERAAADLQHIILPEGEDVRTVEAAAICARDSVAKITVIGNEEKVRELAAEAGCESQRRRDTRPSQVARFRQDWRRFITSCGTQRASRSRRPSRPSKTRFISAI